MEKRASEEGKLGDIKIGKTTERYPQKSFPSSIKNRLGGMHLCE